MRMRSGSGASRTTSTSDSGDLDSSSLPSGQSYNGQHSASLHSQTSAPSSSSSAFHQGHPGHGTYSASSISTFSVTGHSPLPSHSTTSLGVNSNPASALSPIATRMREQDASAMEKYMRRNRSGSASTDVKSQSSNPSSAGPSANGDDISSLPPAGTVPSRRRLRTSMSASQLRTNPKPPFIVTTNASPDVFRSRAGTNPNILRKSPPASLSPPSDRTALPPSPNRPLPIRVSPHPAMRENGSHEIYTGPSSAYAQFPEPPKGSENGSASSSATTNGMPTPTRRLPFHLLSKPLPSIDLTHGNSAHRRGGSIPSMR